MIDREEDDMAMGIEDLESEDEESEDKETVQSMEGTGNELVRRSG